MQIFIELITELMGLSADWQRDSNFYNTSTSMAHQIPPIQEQMTHIFLPLSSMKGLYNNFIKCG